MDQANGTTSPKKKQVLFSIGSYGEGNERVINKISTNGLFASATTDDAPLRPQPSRTLPKARPHSLNFIETASKHKTLPSRHQHIDTPCVEKPACPPSSACNSPAVEDGPIAGKPAFPPQMLDRSLSLEPEQLRHSGRVALTIAAYEGEPRTPTRLDFLPSGRASRASSKASSSTASTPSEDVDGSRMMLQNELTATLKRSNLKKLIEDDVFQENGTSHPPQEESKPEEEPKSIQPIEDIKPTEDLKVVEDIKPTEDVKVVEDIKPTEDVKIVEDTKPTEDVKSTEDIKPTGDIQPTEKLEPKIAERTEEPKDKKPEEKSNETEVIEDLDKIIPAEELETKSEKEEEIAAVLTELENSTEESETLPPPPPPPPMLEPEKPIVKEEPKPTETDLENGEPKAEDLSKDEVPNGSVKQLAVELGKKMTFKADIEKVPEQNGIKNE